MFPRQARGGLMPLRSLCVVALAPGRRLLGDASKNRRSTNRPLRALRPSRARYPAWPFSTREKVTRAAPSFLAAAVTLSPASAQSCLSPRPGWGGFFIGISQILLVVVDVPGNAVFGAGLRGQIRGIFHAAGGRLFFAAVTKGGVRHKKAWGWNIPTFLELRCFPWFAPTIRLP